METQPIDSSSQESALNSALQASSTTEAQPSLDLSAIAREAEEVLATMLPLLSFEAKLTSAPEKNCVRIQVLCPDAARLIGRRGATVNEIQFLLNRILQRRHKFVPRIFLDVESVKEEQPIPQDANPEVIATLRGAIEKVRRWGDPLELGPFSPADRKTITEWLARDREVIMVMPDGKAESPDPQKIRLQLKS